MECFGYFCVVDEIILRVYYKIVMMLEVGFRGLEEILIYILNKFKNILKII